MDPPANSASLAAIWRYPVKSLQGEALTAADIESDGLRGDRRWGIQDRTLSRHHDGTLGTWTQVHAPGFVHIGDLVEVVP